ncbi:hypothetical protein MIR68_012174 [Amoeboaphelidium protococcarum]|nr:hypothetical protein MIR68_012174 [Amoeboaphelidium protococcarum]
MAETFGELIVVAREETNYLIKMVKRFPFYVLLLYFWGQGIVLKQQQKPEEPNSLEPVIVTGKQKQGFNDFGFGGKIIQSEDIDKLVKFKYESAPVYEFNYQNATHLGYQLHVLKDRYKELQQKEAPDSDDSDDDSDDDQKWFKFERLKVRGKRAHAYRVTEVGASKPQDCILLDLKDLQREKQILKQQEIVEDQEALHEQD